MDVYKIIYQQHAIERMAQRGVREEEVQHILLIGETIEVYPNDTPYPGELLSGWSNARPLHVVVATDKAGKRKIVITVYVPNLSKWGADL